MDADGSFQIFPKKRSYISKKSGITSEYINIGYGIHISLSDRDLHLLKEINEHLSNLVNPNIHSCKLVGQLLDNCWTTTTQLITLNYLEKFIHTLNEKKLYWLILNY